MTKDGTDAAIEQVETELKDDKVLVVFLPDCHESLAGIVRAGSASIIISLYLSLQGRRLCKKAQDVL